MAYTQSAQVTLARKKLDDTLADKPGPFASDWTAKANGVLDAMGARKPFSYDLNADRLYDQYRDRYVREGRRAMEDTVGLSSALTGGYASSYAQTAGQQTYQDYLSRLGEVVPQLYQLALDRYTREGDALQQQYENLLGRENQDYDRYRDGVADWRSDREYLAGDYRDIRDFDFGRYTDQRDFDYRQARDREADRQWQAEFDYRAQQDALAAAAKAAKGGGGGGKKKKKTASSGTPGVSPAASALTGGGMTALGLLRRAVK